MFGAGVTMKSSIIRESKMLRTLLVVVDQLAMKLANELKADVRRI